MMRDARSGVALLVRADDKFAFASRGSVDGVTRREEQADAGDGKGILSQPSIPLLARLELCHVEINCFTRPRNIVTRAFESRDVVGIRSRLSFPSRTFATFARVCVCVYVGVFACARVGQL